MTDARGGTDLVLVTGMSGAGRSTALAVLEDMGFEAVDNLPLAFLGRLARSMRDDPNSRPVAIGVDIRNRDFGVESLRTEVTALQDGGGLRVTVLFLDCGDEEIQRRYTETRRRHPLAADRPVADGIRSERRAIAPLAETADLTIDTTDLTVWDFKRRLQVVFGRDRAAGTSITVMSFSFRRGIPREADMVLDVRFLTNPHYDPALRDRTGQDPDVAEAIRADPDFSGFLDDLKRLLTRTLPRQEAEGKSYLTIAFGCTGGRHRSVFLAETVTDWLTETGRSAFRFHRDVWRASDATMPAPPPKQPEKDGP